MVGDVVGKPGRQAAQEWVPVLKREHGADFVIANGENAAGGIGITPDLAESLLNNDIDVITLGNHAWGKRELYSYLDQQPRILRPANYPPGVPGRGGGVFSCPAGPVGVVSLQGRTFMEAIDDPFRGADDILAALARDTRVIFIDFHAEATSEKQAFGFHVDGRASAVIGTHTHVQTADERILPGGAAYLTDVGMTGPVDSIIGMRRDTVLPRFTSQLPSRFEVADGDVQVSAVLIDIAPETGRATAIRRLQVPAFSECNMHRKNMDLS